MPPMPMLQPEDARLLAHFCLASRSLCGSTRARQSVSERRSWREEGRAWVLGYARIGEADHVCDIEHEREDDDWHKADMGCTRGDGYGDRGRREVSMVWSDARMGERTRD